MCKEQGRGYNNPYVYKTKEERKKHNWGSTETLKGSQLGGSGKKSRPRFKKRKRKIALATAVIS